MNKHTFTSQMRVRKQADFQRVHSSAIFASDDVLVVRGAKNGLECIRLGLSVSRQVGIAVTRNRWKRLIREAFRLQQQRLPKGIDIVVRPRRGAVPELQAICRSLPQLASRIARRFKSRESPK